MADNWPEGTRTTSFQLAVEYELNQTPGKLSPLVGSSGTYSDKSVEILDRFGNLYLEPKNGRNEDTNLTDISSSRRWIKVPKSADIAVLLDRNDLKSTRVDIKSPIAVQAGVATRRYHDDQWLAGYFGNAWTGETGDTSIPFKAANVIAHGNTGFTKAKLLAVREKMNLNNVDIEAEMPIMLLDPQSETELLGITEYVNSQYNPGHALSRGEIKPWLGFRFVRANLTSTAAYKTGATLVVPEAGAVALPVFVPSGLHRGVWTEFFGDIGQRRDKKLSEQVYAEACSAVVRLNEDKCYQVVVKHS
ncbi:MAG: phage capsid protein [Sphingobium sp.]|uniref:phage capsid protein n=1 Tax=Sphingobium sp. TaxID=1912891 RepID=UPI003BB15758